MRLPDLLRKGDALDFAQHPGNVVRLFLDDLQDRFAFEFPEGHRIGQTERVGFRAVVALRLRRLLMGLNRTLIGLMRLVFTDLPRDTRNTRKYLKLNTLTELTEFHGEMLCALCDFCERILNASNCGDQSNQCYLCSIVFPVLGWFQPVRPSARPLPQLQPRPAARRP